jgi:HEAT repeat protein
MTTFKTGWGLAAQEVSIVAPEKLRQVKELLSFVVRTLKTLFLYPQNNPIPQEFKRNLFEKFSQFLDEYEELKLVTEQNKLLLLGEVVYEDSGGEEGMALAMYRDGIREIVFQNGLKQEELENFLESLKVALQSKSGEDDLVTLLWEKDFLHLRYTVVEQASDLPEPLVLESSNTEEFEKIYYSEISLEEPAAAEEGKPLVELEDLASEEIARLLKNVASFENEELAEINSLLQIERFYRKQAEVISILFEILTQEEELNGFGETLSLIEKSLNEFLARRQFDLAAEILKQTRKHQEYFKERSAARADKLHATIERLGDKNYLDRLAEYLNQEKDLPSEQIYQYLVQLSPSAIPNLVILLGELKHFSARKLLCQVLEYFAHSHLDPVASGLNDKRWYVVRNVVMVLGRTQESRITTFLKRTVQHSDFRVRKETILALARLNTKEAGLLLIEGLKDSDRKIRSYAIRALSASKEKGALEPLWQIVNSKGFLERGEDEIKETWEALVALGEEQGLQYVSDYVRKFHFLRRARYLEIKLLALKALEKANHPDLVACLEKIAQTGNKQIQKAAQATMEHVLARAQKRREEHVS